VDLGLHRRVAPGVEDFASLYVENLRHGREVSRP
jgi:hypothetical protein